MAIISAVVALLMIYGIDQCASLDEDNATPYPIQVSIVLESMPSTRELISRL